MWAGTMNGSSDGDVENLLRGGGCFRLGGDLL